MSQRPMWIRDFAYPCGFGCVLHSCTVCTDVSDSYTSRETDIRDCPDVLFLSIMRYQFDGGQATRIDKTITCKERISVLVKTDDVSVVLHKLAAQICHQGGLKQGHYWENISRNGKWFRCNDESVAPLPKHKLQQTCLRFSAHKNLM